MFGLCLIPGEQFRRISIAQWAVACQHRECDSDSVSFTNAIIDSLRRQSLLRLPSKLKMNFVCSRLPLCGLWQLMSASNTQSHWTSNGFFFFFFFLQIIEIRLRIRIWEKRRLRFFSVHLIDVMLDSRLICYAYELFIIVRDRPLTLSCSVVLPIFVDGAPFSTTDRVWQLQAVNTDCRHNRRTRKQQSNIVRRIHCRANLL